MGEKHNRNLVHVNIDTKTWEAYRRTFGATKAAMHIDLFYNKVTPLSCSTASTHRHYVKGSVELADEISDDKEYRCATASVGTTCATHPLLSGNIPRGAAINEPNYGERRGAPKKAA